MQHVLDEMLALNHVFHSLLFCEKFLNGFARHDYGRWKSGTSKRWGCMKIACGVLTCLSIGPVGEGSFDAGGLVGEGPRLAPSWQPLSVASGLHFNAGERRALLLRFDHAAGLAVEIEQVIGEAMAIVQRELADRHAGSGPEIDIGHALHDPPGGGEQAVDLFSGALLWVHHSAYLPCCTVRLDVLRIREPDCTDCLRDSGVFSRDRTSAPPAEREMRRGRQDRECRAVCVWKPAPIPTTASYSTPRIVTKHETRDDQMNKLGIAAAITLTLFSISAQSGQVWKCQEGDRVIFSDAPCPSTGKPLQARQLQANIMQAEPVPERNEQGDSYTAASQRGQAPVSVCPSEAEIRNLETKASSITLGKKEKFFLDDEVRRARQCRSGQGKYTAADWNVSRDAQNDQSSISDKQRGRTLAERMHSAANPAERALIEQRRLDEEAFQRQRRAGADVDAVGRALQQAQQQPTTYNCDARGCSSSTGERYQRSGNTNTYFGPQGACRLIGGQMSCP
jgi:hypothetical protein